MRLSTSRPLASLALLLLLTGVASADEEVIYGGGLGGDDCDDCSEIADPEACPDEICSAGCGTTQTCNSCCNIRRWTGDCDPDESSRRDQEACQSEWGACTGHCITDTHSATNQASTGTTPRELLRVRGRILNLSGHVVAEYSSISTNDDVLSPRDERILIRDSATGDRYVIRQSIDAGTGAADVRVEYQGAEIMAISIPPSSQSNSGVIQACADSVSFDASAVTPSQATLAAAAALLNTCNSTTRTALAWITRLGLQHATLARAPAVVSGPIMFPSMTDMKGTAGSPEYLYHSAPFNPQTTAPDSFEQGFGSAYYQ